ncbi:MAG: hypothetical protein AAF357_13740 [Verrucomicrobiota bacterium]
MPSFLFRASLFLSLTFLALCYVDWSGRSQRNLPNALIYSYINRSRQSAGSPEVLILGDSVARQLLDVVHRPGQGVISLACNQAIDLIGHYLLMENAMKANPSVKRVYLVYNPFSFQNDLNHRYTYNYFLKPFYTQEFTPHFTGHAWHQIRAIPRHRFATFPPVRATFNTPRITEPPSRDSIWLSQTTLEYLGKMESLAAERSASFVLFAPPLRESFRPMFMTQIETFRKTGYPHPLLAHYCDTLMFLPDTLYFDKLHFRGEKTVEVRASFLPHLGEPRLMK